MDAQRHNFENILQLAKVEKTPNLQACIRKKTFYGSSSVIEINKDYTSLKMTIFIQEKKSCIFYHWSIKEGCIFHNKPKIINTIQSISLIKKTSEKIIN